MTRYEDMEKLEHARAYCVQIMPLHTVRQARVYVGQWRLSKRRFGIS